MRDIEIIWLLTLGVAAMIFDLWRDKIPNLLIASGLAVGFLFQVIDKGMLGVIIYLGGAALPIILLGPLFYFRMLGAGDIKMFCALGCFMGIRKTLYCILMAFLAGGILSAAFMLKRRNLRERLIYFNRYVRNYLQQKVWLPYRKAEDTGSHIHFSIPILISIALYAGGFY